MGSTYAEFQEHDKGRSTGKLADMVLLSQDVLSMAPAAIRDTHISRPGWAEWKSSMRSSAKMRLRSDLRRTSRTCENAQTWANV